MKIELPEERLAGARDDDPVIVFPPGYIHPDFGKFKDKPESFFESALVRILMETATGDQVPAWIQVVDFYDEPELGRRLGRGRLQTTLPGWSPEALVPFAVEEVIDVVHRLTIGPDGIYRATEV